MPSISWKDVGIQAREAHRGFLRVEAPWPPSSPEQPNPKSDTAATPIPWLATSPLDGTSSYAEEQISPGKPETLPRDTSHRHITSHLGSVDRFLLSHCERSILHQRWPACCWSPAGTPTTQRASTPTPREEGCRSTQNSPLQLVESTGSPRRGPGRCRHLGKSVRGSQLNN